MFSINVTIGESIFISIFSIIVVFLILLLISYLIDGIRKVLSYKNNSVKQVETKKTNNKELKKIDSVTMAIIVSAIDAHRKDSNYVIKNIK